MQKKQMIANLIAKQILLASTKENFFEKVWRIWMWMLGCKGLSMPFLFLILPFKVAEVCVTVRIYASGRLKEIKCCFSILLLGSNE